MLTIADCRPEVKEFAILMEQQLRRHDAKRGTGKWRDDNPHDLMRHLEEEVRELISELNRSTEQIMRPLEPGETFIGGLTGSGPNGERMAGTGKATFRTDDLDQRIRTKREAADVANMAMMVADAAAGLLDTAPTRIIEGLPSRTAPAPSPFQPTNSTTKD